MSDQNVKPRLPVIWQGADGVARTNAVVGEDGMTLRELSAFGSQVVDVCGGCKFFQPQHLSGNKPLLNKFLATTLIEAEWKDKKFIGQDVNTLGRCGADDKLATGPLSKACDQFRPKNGRIG